LYEIVPQGVEADVPIRVPDSLRYQASKEQPSAMGRPELLYVRVRYKQPDGDRSRLLAQALVDGRIGAPSLDLRFQTAVAEFGLLLRRSPWKGAADIAQVIARARDAIGPDPDGYRAEFVRLAESAQAIGVQETAAR
jgi:Ca-activated chloride channel family protein